MLLQQISLKTVLRQSNFVRFFPPILNLAMIYFILLKFFKYLFFICYLCSYLNLNKASEVF